MAAVGLFSTILLPLSDNHQICCYVKVYGSVAVTSVELGTCVHTQDPFMCIHISAVFYSQHLPKTIHYCRVDSVGAVKTNKPFVALYHQ
jgi:hypothetical protein